MQQYASHYTDIETGGLYNVLSVILIEKALIGELKGGRYAYPAEGSDRCRQRSDLPPHRAVYAETVWGINLPLVI